MMTSSSLTWEQSRASSNAFTCLESVDSTNTWLMQKSVVTPTEIVLTLNQTGGRGRWNRQWVNKPGEGLALSFVVPELTSAQWEAPAPTWVPLLVGVAVVQSLWSAGVEEATLKWPNDVLVGKQKLAGVLCEVRTDGLVVAGVGINIAFLNQRPDEKALSLDDVLGDSMPILDHLVAGIIHHVSELVGLDPERRRDAVVSVMGTIGQRVQVLGRDGSRRAGLAEDLDDQGGLLVRMEDGSISSVTSSEIEHLYQ